MGYSNISKEIFKRIEETYGENSKKELLLSRINHFDLLRADEFAKDVMTKIGFKNPFHNSRVGNWQLSNIGFEIMIHFQIPMRSKDLEKLYGEVS